MDSNVLDQIKFNADGLITAVAQDAATGQILMLAWMNKQSLVQTLETKVATYFSRSRQKLWVKGESSGHTQKVKEVLLDCDGDALVLKVEQTGVACHTGRVSCFYLQHDHNHWKPVLDVVKDPSQIYADKTASAKTLESKAAQPALGAAQNPTDTLAQLEAVIQSRKQADPSTSYVAKLMSKGPDAALKKVAEEAGELIMAAKDVHSGVKTADDLVYETADLWFHSMVALVEAGVSPQSVLSELERRFGLSGLEEKASRSS